MSVKDDTFRCLQVFKVFNNQGFRYTGHLYVAQCLLDNGASCSEYTFDGERCYYVALTADIRQLLLAYAQRWLS